MTLHPQPAVVKCKHAAPGGAGWVTCARGLYGGRPSAGVCAKCLGVPVAPPPDPWPAVVQDIIEHGTDEWIERLNRCRSFVPHGGCVPCKVKAMQRQLMEAWKCRVR